MCTSFAMRKPERNENRKWRICALRSRPNAGFRGLRRLSAKKVEGSARSAGNIFAYYHILLRNFLLRRICRCGYSAGAAVVWNGPCVRAKFPEMRRKHGGFFFLVGQSNSSKHRLIGAQFSCVHSAMSLLRDANISPAHSHCSWSIKPFSFCHYNSSFILCHTHTHTTPEMYPVRTMSSRPSFCHRPFWLPALLRARKRTSYIQLFDFRSLCAIPFRRFPNIFCSFVFLLHLFV